MNRLEVIFFIALMIVPVLALVSLMLSLITMKSQKALRGLVVNLASSIKTQENPVDVALRKFDVEES